MDIKFMVSQLICWKRVKNKNKEIKKYDNGNHFFYVLLENIFSEYFKFVIVGNHNS